MPRPDRHDRTSPAKIERAHRVDEALKHRIRGLTYREIAQEMGVSESNAHGLVSEGKKDIPKQSADLVFNIELDRLDTAARALWPMVVDGDVKAIEQWLKLHDRMVKLFHLDTVHNETGDSGARSGLASLIDAVKGKVTAEDVAEATRKP